MSKNIRHLDDLAPGDQGQLLGCAGDGELGCLQRSTHGGVDAKLRRVLGEDGRGGDEGGKSDVLDHCVLWGRGIERKQEAKKDEGGFVGERVGDCETVVYKRRFLPGQEGSCRMVRAVGARCPSVLASWERVMLEIQALIQVREPRRAIKARVGESAAEPQDHRTTGPRTCEDDMAW